MKLLVHRTYIPNTDLQLDHLKYTSLLVILVFFRVQFHRKNLVHLSVFSNFLFNQMDFYQELYQLELTCMHFAIKSSMSLQFLSGDAQFGKTVPL